MSATLERLAIGVESLALGFWAGAMLAFAFVFAPAAFVAIASLTTFATLVQRVLGELGVFGSACGIVALAALAVRGATLRGRSSRLRFARATLVLVACLATAYEVRAIVPRMSAVAAQIPGALDSVPKSDPRRAEYDRLHARSTQVYGLAFLCVATSLATVGFGRRREPA